MLYCSYLSHWVWSNRKNKECEWSRMNDRNFRSHILSRFFTTFCVKNRLFFAVRILLVLKSIQRYFCSTNLTVLLLFTHLKQYRKPREQKKSISASYFGHFYIPKCWHNMYLMSWTLCQHLISSNVDFSFIWPILIENCSSFSMSTSRVNCSKIPQGDRNPAKHSIKWNFCWGRKRNRTSLNIDQIYLTRACCSLDFVQLYGSYKPAVNYEWRSAC